MSVSAALPIVLPIVLPLIDPVAKRLVNVGVEAIDSAIDRGKAAINNAIPASYKVETMPTQIHSGLASSFGNLNKESVSKVDEKLKILVSGAVRALEQQKAKGIQLSWENVTTIFSQTSLMEPVPQQDINHSDIFSKKINDGIFQFGGTVDQKTVKEVEAWFIKLLNNDLDIIKSTKIDINFFGQIVGATGTRIGSFQEFFAKTEYNETTIVDIGVLRFPDIDNPYVKVYRIQLKAWRDVRRILIHQKDENGIIGQFNSRHYKPRASVIEGIRSDVRKKAIDEANSLFD